MFRCPEARSSHKGKNCVLLKEGNRMPRLGRKKGSMAVFRKFDSKEEVNPNFFAEKKTTRGRIQ